MSTIEHPPTKSVPASTGRKYSSVQDLLKCEGVSPEIQSAVNVLASETRITRSLGKLRAKHGLTQEQMGEKMELTQSAISKLESGRDEELKLGEIRDYVRALGERLSIAVGRPLNHVEAIKMYATGMRFHMLELAKVAHSDEQMDTAVQAFFGEAFFNILSILEACHQSMPHGVEGCEIRLIEVSGSKVTPSASLSTATLLREPVPV